MKPFLNASVVLLCTLLCLGGCTARSAQPSGTPETSSASSEPSSQAAPAPSPTSTPSPSEAPSSEPEPDYPEPVFSEAGRAHSEEAMGRFAAVFGSQGSFSSTTELDADLVLEYCLRELLETQILNAYYFEALEDGRQKLPQALVTETALQNLGLVNFFGTESPLYDKDSGCFLYQAAPAAQNFVILPAEGAEDGHLSYTVQFFAPEDSARTSPTAVRTYLCKLKTVNQLPQLQLVSTQEAAQ